LENFPGIAFIEEKIFHLLLYSDQKHGKIYLAFSMFLYSIYTMMETMETNHKPKFKPDPKLKLLDQVREVLRYHHYAYRTEKTYCDWILRYIKFHGGKIHPAQMGKTQIDAFLSHLATQGIVSASTQRQALNAIVFLYRRVLDQPIEDQLEPIRAKKHSRPPVVMTQAEVQRVISCIGGTHLLMAKMLYGCGLRLMICVRLRIQDLDFDRNIVYVRAAKGGRDAQRSYLIRFSRNCAGIRRK
jgi:integrase